VPEANSGTSFQIIDAGGGVETVELDSGDASRLMAEAVKAANAAGIGWNDQDLVLRPQPKLVQLVVASRTLALQGMAEEEAAAETAQT
jgi:hypothetical protein